MPSSDDAFAQAFDAVVRHTGQTLTGIRSRLNERGISISTATLSYWRSGVRRPDARSLAAVTAIERILELIPGTPSRHLVGRSRRVGTVAPAVDIGATDDASREIFAALDASDLDDVRMLSVQEIVDVGEHGSVSAIATMLLLQCVRNRFERIALALPSPVPTQLVPIVEVPGVARSVRACGIRTGTGW